MPLQKEQLSRMTIHGFKSIKSCDISFGKINVLTVQEKATLFLLFLSFKTFYPRISRYLLVKAV